MARETWKASGAARSPNSPISGARAFDAAVPRASPAQTSPDQVTLPNTSATTDFKPGTISNPAVKSRSRVSIAKPRRIASHETRTSTLPSPGLLSGEPVVDEASGFCCGSVISKCPAFDDTRSSRGSPETILAQHIPAQVRYLEACNTQGPGNSEKGYSRQLGFRRMGFSETQFIPL